MARDVEDGMRDVTFDAELEAGIALDADLMEDLDELFDGILFAADKVNESLDEERG